MTINKKALQTLVGTFKTAGAINRKEEHIQSMFTLPLLALLGYKPNNIVINEGQAVKTGLKPDILLKNDAGNTLMVIESKEASKKDFLDKGYQDKTFVQQLFGYCKAEGIQWGILTNFIEWRVYSVFQNRLYKDKKYAFHDLLWQGANKSDYVDLVSDQGLEFFEKLARDKLTSIQGKWDSDPVYYPQQADIKEKFFQDLKAWRASIRSYLAVEYSKQYDIELIDLITQKILDRLIFIDYCADNGIVAQDRLHAILEAKGNTHAELKRIFSDMDEKFNSELFSISEADSVDIPDSVIKPIIAQLADTDFSKLSVHVIGEVYENYLGELLKIGKKTVKVDDSRADQKKKSQGIYYTPEYIVDYIVENSVGSILKKCRTTADIEKIKVLDPACGSGSFLIRVFEEFLKHYERIQPSGMFQFEVRKKILQRNIYGVDLDERAVEIAKLNLLVKALENSSHANLIGRKLLPNLKINIRCGNSLVSGEHLEKDNGLFWQNFAKDISELKQLRHKFHGLTDDREQAPIYEKIKVLEFTIASKLDARLGEFFTKITETKPLNYSVAYPEVFGEGGFDCVLGNPPWGSDIDNDLKYLKTAFPRTTKEHTDIFKIFIDFAIKATKKTGQIAMIVPNTILRQKRLQDVREVLLENQIASVVDLGEDVFEDVVAPSCIFIVRKQPALPTFKTTVINISHIGSKEKTLSKEQLAENTTEIAQKDFSKNPDLAFVAKQKSSKASIVPLGDFPYVQCKDTGIQCQRKNVGKQARTKSDLAKRFFYQGKQRLKSDKMFWKGRDMNKYYLAPITDRFCVVSIKNSLKANEVVYFNKDVYETKPKIMFRQTADHVIAAVDYDGRWFDGSVIGLIPTANSPYAIEYIAGLLNSTHLKTIYQALVQETGRVFAQVKLAKVKQLPLRLIDFKNSEDTAKHDKIVSLVRELNALNEDSSTQDANSIKYQAAIRQIDQVVNELYGLS